MRIIFISDTHSQHRLLTAMPEGDIIIHGGDLTMRGSTEEADDFIDWFASLKYSHKIFIAGNHDFCFEEVIVDDIKRILPNNIHYLYNSGIEIDGIKIYGSPITPTFHNLAFNRERGENMKCYWGEIPMGTNIVVTHGPPLGIRDRTANGTNIGCENLLSRIKEVKPKYHLFGHAHEDYGEFEGENTKFINGSILDERYNSVNRPIVIDI